MTDPSPRAFSAEVRDGVCGGAAAEMGPFPLEPIPVPVERAGRRTYAARWSTR